MFKSLAPKFINKIDTYLLINHPVLWMSKIHYVLWHGAVLWGISAILGAIIPINLQDRVEYGLWYFLFTVIALVILCFWIYNYIIFNKEKNYGSKKFIDEYKNFILVFITVAIFLLIPWPFEVVYSNRIAMMYNDKEVLQDLNKLNENDPYLANSTNNYYSWYDTTSHIQYFNLRKLNPYGSNYYTPYYLRLDSAKYPELLTEFQLSKKYKPSTDIDQLIKKIEIFILVSKKYNIKVDYTSKELAERYVDLLNKEKVSVAEFSNNYTYQYQLQTTFNNLCEAKFTTLFIFKPDYLWVIFYFIFSISTFLTLFKITYWQQYLIMLVVLLLYPLIMFIFSQLMPYSNYMRSPGFYECIILALVVFSCITLFITSKNQNHFKPFYNIFNQLFYVALIYSPLLILAFLHDNTDLFHNKGYDYYSSGNLSPLVNEPSNINTSPADYERALNSIYSQYWYDEYKRWIKILKYAGIIIFLITLPFFKELFVKQISLPKKN